MHSLSCYVHLFPSTLSRLSPAFSLRFLDHIPRFFLDVRSSPPRSTPRACVFEAILLTLSARSTERSEERSVEVLLRSTAPEKSVGHFRTASGSWAAMWDDVEAKSLEIGLYTVYRRRYVRDYSRSMI